MSALRNSPFVREFAAGTLPLEWVATRMVSDDPAKALARAARETLLSHELKAIFGTPAARVDLVSPYFIPTAAGDSMRPISSRRPPAGPACRRRGRAGSIMGQTATPMIGGEI